MTDAAVLERARKLMDNPKVGWPQWLDLDGTFRLDADPAGVWFVRNALCQEAGYYLRDMSDHEAACIVERHFRDWMAKQQKVAFSSEWLLMAVEKMLENQL